MNNKTYDLNELLEKHKAYLKSKKQEVDFLLKEIHFAESKIEFFNKEKERFDENIIEQKNAFGRLKKTTRFFLIITTVLLVLQFEFPLFNAGISQLLWAYFCVVATALFIYQLQKKKLSHFLATSKEYENDTEEIIDKLEGGKTKIKFLDGEIHEVNDIISILDFCIDKEGVRKKLTNSINANRRLLTKQIQSEVYSINEKLDAQKNKLMDDFVVYINNNIFIFNNNDIKKKVFTVKQKAEDYSFLYKKLAMMLEEYIIGNFDKYEEYRDTFTRLSYLATEKNNMATETAFGGLRKIV